MPPTSFLDDGVEAIYYTMPLLDRDGEAYGVVGVEITTSYMAQKYIPGKNLPYQNSFYLLAQEKDNVIDLGWFLPSGPVAYNFLKDTESLSLNELRDTGLYETQVGGLGAMDCALEDLRMYSRNSPFADEAWKLVGFVPESVLNESSTGVRSALVSNIVGTLVISFTAIFILTYFATRRISGLSKHVESLSPETMIHFEKTGMREIDDLATAVEKLNKSVVNASKAMTKILELTHLPLGVFEVSEDSEFVVISDYVHGLLNIPRDKKLTEEEWDGYYRKLVAQKYPGYEDTYSFVQDDGEGVWLRIVESPTETGRVGIIMNVTKDVEERIKLAHERDYDALTQLLNRNAFKREVHNIISADPDKIGAMIFADLDNLKYINDTFGHDMGDRLIMRAGEMFSEFERMGGIVSRISGDEFAVYIHGFNSKNEARVAIENNIPA
jgi:PAS domain-containing protein